jgi:hypothetical protein
MSILIVIKILIIGALFGAVFMFISAFTGSPRQGLPGAPLGPNKFLVIIRFILKLIVFILLIIFPFFLLKLIA